MTRKELRQLLVENGITAERALALKTTHRLLMCAVAGYKHATGVDGDLPVAASVVSSVNLIGAALAGIENRHKFQESDPETDILKYLKPYADTAIRLGLEASARNRVKLDLARKENGLNGKKPDGRKTRHLTNPPSKVHPFRRKNNARAEYAMARKVKPSEVF